MPDDDKKALTIVEEICSEKRAEFKVYNISTFTGKLKAHLRGIKNTPTIVIDSNIMEGVPEKEQLISLLK